MTNTERVIFVVIIFIPNLLTKHVQKCSTLDIEYNNINETDSSYLFESISDKTTTKIVMEKEATAKNVLAKKDSISITFKRTISVKSYCFIRKNKINKLHRVSNETRIRIFMIKRIFIPPNSLCCLNHLNDYGMLTNDSISNLEVHSETSNLDKNSVEDMIIGLTQAANSSTFFAMFNDFNLVDSVDCKYFKKHKNHEITFSFNPSIQCKNCGSVSTESTFADSSPPWIFVETLCSKGDLMHISDLKDNLKLEISSVSYSLLCCTIGDYEREHFTSIIQINDVFYYFDDLNPILTKNIPEKQNICICMYLYEKLK